MIPLPPRYTQKGKAFSGGGMSEAILCKDNHLERTVVIKTLKPGGDQKRLLDEVAALSDIRSKHVVQVYDVIRDDEGDVVAIVEEYLPGDDLAASVPVNSAVDAMKIGYAISCGISDIHETGRIHRDIKLNNMKYDAEGCLKIFDFGLSRPDEEAATQGGVGTPGYMAPELCAEDVGQDVEFTQAVNVFAFGATMLKLIRGSLPKDMRKYPPELPCADADFAHLKVGLPAKVAEIFNKCLSIYCKGRPDISEVRDTIAVHLQKDQHRATVVSDGKPYIIDAQARNVKIGLPALGSFTLTYDGYEFLLTEVAGYVAINNVHVTKLPKVLPGSCVITLGAPDLQWVRRHITVDVSHPEVVL